MTVTFLFILGLLFGSFVNALVWRLHERRNWVSERSECPVCHHQLAAKDLVPIFSWLWLRGKCRYCRKPIQDSPLVELATPVLFVISYLFWPDQLQGIGLFTFICWLIFLVGFIALAVYDLRWFLLPNVVVFPLMGLAALQLMGQLALGGRWQDAVSSLAGAAVMSGLFYLIFTLSKGQWIGFGDVKLAVVLGILAGGILPALVVLFIASLLGTIVSLPLVMAGKANRKSHLPFGPMLIAGTIIVVLFGQTLIAAYSRLIMGI